jgi:predicted Zn-dependent peptidase
MIVALKRENLWVRIGLFFFFFFFWMSAGQAELRDQVFETTLSNGLKVILLEDSKAPLITFHIWYRNEEWGKTGLSHLLEHMMFKGTKKYGPEEYSRIIQENGGETNAFTSRDYTGYFATLRSDRVQVVMDLEADRMQNLNLREEDFATERMVVMEERRQRTEDDRLPAAALSLADHRLDGRSHADHPGGPEEALPDLLPSGECFPRSGGGF